MTIKEIIGGLKFTVDMFLFDPSTGETYKEPRNDMDKTTIDACNGAIELLERTEWIPVSERLPEENGVYIVSYEDSVRVLEWFNGKWFFYPSNPAREETGTITAWMPLPEPYKESEV